MPDHQEYLDLLHTNPAKLLELYLPAIRMIVWGFIRRGMFRAQDYEDIVQSVAAEFVVRLPAIRERYTGQARITTYMSSSVRNLCLTLHRQAKPREETPGGLDQVGGHSDGILESVAMQEAIDALEEVLLLFAADSRRLCLLLKVHFRLPLTARDILAAYPGCADEEAAEAARHYNEGVSRRTSVDTYARVVPLVDRMEGKSLNADSLRHWVSMRIPEIITLLNTRLAGGCIDGDDLRTLLEVASVRNSAQR